MTPYYEQDGITIYHGGAEDILPTLDPVDLVLTDPPYVGLTGGYDLKALGGVAAVYSPMLTVGDEWGANLDWVPLAWDIAKYGLITFCTHHSISEIAALLPATSRVALLTWYKRNAPPTGKNVPGYNTEFIWCFKKKTGLKWDEIKTTMIDIPNINAGIMATERIVDNNGRAVHPAQKPVALMRTLLKMGGDTILDPFMGTGTTLRAAKDMGRRAIGIDKDRENCEIAVRRLQQAVLSL